MKELNKLLEKLPYHAKTFEKIEALKLLVANLEHIPSTEIEELVNKHRKNF